RPVASRVRERRAPLAVTNRPAEVDVFDAGERDDVTRRGALELDALQPLPAVDAGQLARRLRAVEAAERVLPGGDQLARDDAADGEAAHVVVVAQVVGLEAQRGVWLVRRAGKPAHDGCEERPEVGARAREVQGGRA